MPCQHRVTQGVYRAHVSQFSRTCIGSNEVDGAAVILHDNKLYIRSPSLSSDDSALRSSLPFDGCLRHLPDQRQGSNGSGLVSLIEGGRCGTWIYVDKDTHAVKYDTQDTARQHFFDRWTFEGSGTQLLMDGWEGFIAAKEAPGLWALYFDVHDDGLKDKISGCRMLEVELSAVDNVVVGR